MAAVRTVVLGVISSLFLASAAVAEPRELATSGYWRAFGGTSDNGTPVCGVQTTFGINGSGGGFLLKWFAGNDFLTVQLYRPSWNIPRDVQAPVTVVLDGQRWNVVGKAGVRPNMLEFYVRPEKVREFVHDFTAANGMVVTFDTGSERPWTASLAGNSAVVDVMVRCVARYAGADSATPFSYLPTGQPYAPAPADSTQPFQQPASVKDGGTKSQLPPKN